MQIIIFLADFGDYTVHTTHCNIFTQMLETLRTKKCHSASGSIAMLVEKAGFRQKLETHTVAPLGNEGAVKEGMAFFPTEETDAVIGELDCKPIKLFLLLL